MNSEIQPARMEAPGTGPVVLATTGVPVHAWVRGVPLDSGAEEQLRNIAQLPVIHNRVAVMPDVHRGIGATIGSVIPTLGAIIPAAVGVDIGCGMMAVRTTLRAADLPDQLAGLRSSIERRVPHGRTDNGGPNDRGAFRNLPEASLSAWAELDPDWQRVAAAHPKLARGQTMAHLGTLGGGNHFIEVCLDEEDRVWVVLHSGSRGVGNRIGQHFIALARADMQAVLGSLPDADMAYFSEGTPHFDDYVHAVHWAQRFAAINRSLLMAATLHALAKTPGVPPFVATDEAVQCHHNYVAREHHFGADVFVTRKGAVRAGLGELRIIPGSMGARTFIVRGKGNPESLCSCSHGAGRLMSRTEAKKRFSLEDHLQATASVECRKDKDVIDETPGAYKSIEAVMAAQADLVEVVHTLHQVVCVKG